MRAWRLLNIPLAEHRTIRPQVAYALAAFEEVAKFLPEGEDSIPADRFTSELGRTLYEKDLTRFTRERIEDSLKRGRAILVDLDHFSPPVGSFPGAGRSAARDPYISPRTL
ncbi:hypothetical protein [Streptomyces sp. NPDC059816]|uniref:hypothetical protein n=1 Tax=Streptomyces sp. NPDC059816 TaxID=3346960 RepID=UPI00364B3535